MVEVVFSESAGGSLGSAAINNKHMGGVSTAIIADEQDGLPNKEKIEKIIREQEEKEWLNWESAVPLNIKAKRYSLFSAGSQLWQY